MIFRQSQSLQHLANRYPEQSELFEQVWLVANHIVDNEFSSVVCDNCPGQIPILFTHGKSLALAWEKAVIMTTAFGTLIQTQYDRPEDPPSIDCSMTMVIEDPLSDPMIHRAFPGGLEDLEEYRQEVVDGVKDHWVRDHTDPDDKRWEYTYHERMIRYGKSQVNQFEAMAQQLANAYHTRRAQMITWQPELDNTVVDPPCWQSLWGRIMRDYQGMPYLNLNMRFRSRDAYKAAFMNDFAFIHLGKALANRVSELADEKIELGRFVDQSDSFHIYGSYFDELVYSFLPQYFNRSVEDRTWTLEFATPFFEEAKPEIIAKIQRQDEKYKK